MDESKEEVKVSINAESDKVEENTVSPGEIQGGEPEITFFKSSTIE